MMYFDLVRLYGKSYDDDKTSLGVPNITKDLMLQPSPYVLALTKIISKYWQI